MRFDINTHTQYIDIRHTLDILQVSAYGREFESEIFRSGYGNGIRLCQRVLSHLVEQRQCV